MNAQEVMVMNSGGTGGGHIGHLPAPHPNHHHGDSRDFHDSNEDHIRVREVEQSPPGGTTHTHEYTDEYVDNNYGLHQKNALNNEGSNAIAKPQKLIPSSGQKRKQ